MGSTLSRVNRVNLMRLRVRLGYLMPADLVEVWEARVSGWPVLVYAQAAAVAGEPGFRLTCAEHGATRLAERRPAARVWARNVDAWCSGCTRWASEDAPVGTPVDSLAVPSWLVARVKAEGSPVAVASLPRPRVGTP